MIHISKNLSSPPKALLDSKWNKIKADASVNPKHKADSKCYRGTVIDELEKLYNFKCAVCERSIGIDLEVDHYRPRKPRTCSDPNDKHSGYGWLTYEWSNLMPLCSNCNRYKSNHFPIFNVIARITNFSHPVAYDFHKLQTTEEPYLINPEFEEFPEKHFLYQPNGTVSGRTDSGRVTIEIYKLNSRSKLRDRRKILDSILRDISEAFNSYMTFKNRDVLKLNLYSVFEKTLLNANHDSPLSLFNLYIFKYFDKFIIEKLPESTRIITKKMYVEFIK